METLLRFRWLIVLSVGSAAPSLAQQSVPPILLGHQATVIDAPPPAPALQPLALSASEKPLSAFSISALSLRDSIVALVRAQVGRKYKHGGESPRYGFDCSGLVHYVMAALKIDTPRGPVSFDDMRNPIQNIYIKKVEKKQLFGYEKPELWNTVIKTYPNVSQFWTYGKEKFLAQPVYSREFPPCKFCD